MLSKSDRMLEVFIHLVQPLEKTWGLDVDHLKHPNVNFFETYVGAGLGRCCYGNAMRNISHFEQKHSSMV
jgi:hypothetical protein